MKRFQQALLLVIGTAAVSLSCDRGAPSSPPSTQAVAPEKPKPADVRLSPDAIAQNHVEIGTVEMRVLIPRIGAPARVTFDAEAMAHIGAPVAGRVAEMKVRLGDSVSKGDELLIVESPDLGEAQSDFLQKKSAADAASAAVEPARIAYERGKSLYDQSQGLSLAEVQKREAEFRAAQAAARAASAAGMGAQNKLSLMGMSPEAVSTLEKTTKLTPRYAVRSPLSGQVIQRDLTVGSLVGPDKDLLLEVADVSKVWVLADVAEAHYSRVTKGAIATVIAAALPGQSFDGTVTLVAPSLDATTRTLQVRIEINAPKSGAALKPGMLARASIRSGATPPEPTLAVPDSAVVTMEDETVVFLPAAGDSGKFTRKTVEVGESIDGWTPVHSGLAAGDKVVTQGAAIIRAEFTKPAEEE